MNRSRQAILNLLIVFLSSLIAGTVAAEALPADISSASLVEIGRRIYQEGIVETGELLRGESAAHVTFTGKQAACIRCHRKSGLGTSEGNNTVRPITGTYLFLPPESDGRSNTDATEQTPLRQRALSRQGESRAAYTQATFARSLRDGVNSAGQSMDRLMPRYALNDKEVAALAAYLKTLAAHPDPGVDQTTIHFATVIMPGVDPRQSQAMLDVLKAFVAGMNSETRSEVRRRTVATEPMYLSYRKWSLHVWTLTGPAEGWKAQLEQLYQQQPVFAVISGIGGANWQPMHEFCEQQEIPCLFPNSDLPVTDGGYYSFYFSRGMALEAEVLAQYLSRVPSQREIGANLDQKGVIMQVFRKDDSRGVQAAQVFRSTMQKSKERVPENQTGVGVDIVDGLLPANLTEESWRQMLADRHPQTLVLWVGKDDLMKLGSWVVGASAAKQIYLSASMLGGDIARNPSFLGNNFNKSLDSIRLVYPFELSNRKARHMQRTRLWLKSKNIALTDERVQASTYFAATVAGDTVSHLLSNFSRDYFIELVEHMVGRSLATSVYPPLSLGPGQRFASRGAYLVRYSSDPNGDVEPVTDWIVPD